MGFTEFNSYIFIIAASLLIIISFFFNVISKKTNIPSVLLLISIYIRPSCHSNFFLCYLYCFLFFFVVSVLFRILVLLVFSFRILVALLVVQVLVGLYVRRFLILLFLTRFRDHPAQSQETCQSSDFHTISPAVSFLNNYRLNVINTILFISHIFNTSRLHDSNCLLYI